MPPDDDPRHPYLAPLTRGGDGSSRAGTRLIEALVRIERGGAVHPTALLDATLAARGRRLLIETPPPGLAPGDRAALERVAESAVRAARLPVGWATAALRLSADGDVTPLACHAGLPPGAEALESIAEVDLGEEAERLRRGEAARPLLVRPGCALAAHLAALASAEAPSSGDGRVEHLRLPWGAGLRVEPAVAEGDPVPIAAQRELLLLVAQGRDRQEALARLRLALVRTELDLAGGETTKPLLVALLERPEIEAGRYDEGWVEELLERGDPFPRHGAEIALLAAAVASYEERMEEAKQRFLATARRGRPEVVLEAGLALELRHQGHVYLGRVAKLAPTGYRVEVDGTELELELRDGAGGRGALEIGGRVHRIFRRRGAGGFRIDVDGVTHRLTENRGTLVRSPMPGIVVAVAAREREEIVAGAPLVVIEAMKMETTLAAERAGVVRELFVRPGSQVVAGEPLLEIEPAGPAPAERAGGGGRLDLGPLAASGPQRSPAAEPAEAARRLFLGYDLDAHAAARAVATAPRPGSPEGERRELEALAAHQDVLSLFRPLPVEEPEDDLRRSVEEYLFTYLRDLDAQGGGLPEPFLRKLRRALAHYGIAALDRTPALEEALFRLALAHRRAAQHAPPALALLERRLAGDDGDESSLPLRDLVDRLIVESRGREPDLYDLAREVRYRRFDRPLLLEARRRDLDAAQRELSALAAGAEGAARARALAALVDCPQPLHEWLAERAAEGSGAARQLALEVLVRRYYRLRDPDAVLPVGDRQDDAVTASYVDRGTSVRLYALFARRAALEPALERLSGLARTGAGAGIEIVADLYLWSEPSADAEEVAGALEQALARFEAPPHLRRVAIALAGQDLLLHFTFRRGERGALVEERLARGLHPMVARRLGLWRLANFEVTRLPAEPGIHLVRAVGREDPLDERLIAFAEVRDLSPIRDREGRVAELPQLEHAFLEAVAAVRLAQTRRGAAQRSLWNRIVLDLWPPLRLSAEELREIVRRLAPHTAGLGFEKVVVRGRLPEPESGRLGDWLLEISNPGEGAPTLRFRRPSSAPLKPLRSYARKVIDLKQKGLPYAYDILRLLAPPAEASGPFPPGEFVEHDLDAAGRLLPVDRPPGENQANVVVGLVRNFTERYPEGMTRVALLGDASRGLGALAEPECRRIQAALALAAELRVPVDWFALSAGARIAMESGSENMDWIARVLRSLVERTQAGLEVNVVVVGINVGAQPYWNAEATMLMHTRGILVMTPDASMVLTGKRALDFSGGVSAADNLGIGGYQRIMGPNGQAQYLARDLADACRILLAHYEHAYVAPGERFPRPAPSRDPRDRDVRDSPHGGLFATVGEIFSDASNPGRKKPFEIRKVMAAVADRDHPPLERWPDMRDAEIAVVWDAHVGGHPVAMIGFESRPLPRLGWVPAYGPHAWSGGTLFPQASKKIARAINAASGSRPLVVLANLSGFDGSPESMRQLQLEYGAEIGRAVVNFRGPIVFVVISRYHGGAFVVFSGTLHDNMQVAALDGTYASVIGGAPAAAVVFAREVEKRTRRDPRVAELERRLADPGAPDRAALHERLSEVSAVVRAEKIAEVAVEYDGVHDIERARRVGSVHEILPPQRLRPWVIEAVERGMARALQLA